jgi:hypothetical protein
MDLSDFFGSSGSKIIAISVAAVGGWRGGFIGRD